MDSAADRVAPEVTLAWFPLVARPRPTGRPLETRIAKLAELAASLSEATGRDRVSRAAEVCNRAALIASDCDIPDMARELCYRQNALFAQAGPLPGWAVELAIRPILNVPRQLIREGDGDRAYSMLKTLDHAAQHRMTAIADDGWRIELGLLAHTADAHKTVCTLTQAALLADGTRALTLAGRWREAADRAAEHRDVDDRLLDGRQAAILALLHEGDSRQALAMVDRSSTAGQWDHTVQRLLRALCLHGTSIGAHGHPMMLAASRRLVQAQDLRTALARARAALIALEIAANCADEAPLQPLRAATISTALNDAYAARDALGHPQLREFLTTQQRSDLNELVRVSGLGAGVIPPKLYQKLTDAVSCAEGALKHALGRL